MGIYRGMGWVCVCVEGWRLFERGGSKEEEGVIPYVGGEPIFSYFFV
jgi:hypothetical protein